MSAKVHITSEVGRLKQVVVHSPGKELLAVTPGNRQEYLYDDIIDLDVARQEHSRFVAILSKFAQVFQLRDLLTETLSIPEAREFLFQRSEEVTADKSLSVALRNESVDVLVDRYIEGWPTPLGPFSAHLDRPSHQLPAVPNLFFMRDAAVVMGSHAVVSAMRFASRWPEEVLLRTLFGYHPHLASTPILYDGSDERRTGFSLEGGDIHPVREDTVLIGLSERTTAAALDVLTDRLFAHTPFSHVVAVLLPEKSTAIHLDMVWTQVDKELCAAHPPAFKGPNRSPVLYRRKGQHTVTEPASLFSILKDIGMPMEPIYVGGPRSESQDREQWASGCNFFAVAPGQVLAYDRNDETLKAMESFGFRRVVGDHLLLGKDHIKPNERAVITFTGSELVRGGGGPRCMTFPICRESV
jgi:arginine deiminase